MPHDDQPRPRLAPVETPTDPAAIRTAALAEAERDAAARLAHQRRCFLAGMLLGQFDAAQARQALVIIGTPDMLASRLVGDVSTLIDQAGAS